MSTEALPRTVAQPAPVGRIVMIGAVFGLLAGVLCLVVYGVGRLLGVPFEVARPGSDELMAVPWWLVPLTCVAAGVVGGLLASLARAHAHGPGQVMAGGVAVGVLSLASPLLQPSGVPWSTRIWLVVLHVIAVAIIVPALSRGTTSDDPPPGEIERLARR